MKNITSDNVLNNMIKEEIKRRNDRVKQLKEMKIPARKLLKEVNKTILSKEKDILPSVLYMIGFHIGGSFKKYELRNQGLKNPSKKTFDKVFKIFIKMVRK